MTVAAYLTPRSQDEATELLSRHGADLLVMAGGTVAMPLINEGISLPEVVMGLRHAGLDTLDEADGTLRIGATTTLSRLAGQDVVPMLADAARSTASWSVRNMATVGGNVFTPPPGGDVAVALLALDADVILASVRGERVLPLADLPTGFMTTGHGARRAARLAARPAPARRDRVREARSPARQHAGGRHGRGAGRLVRRTGRRRADRARRGRAAPDPGTANGTSCWSDRASTRSSSRRRQRLPSTRPIHSPTRSRPSGTDGG